MPRYIAEDDAFRVLSEYYKHKTYYQHVALAEAIQEVPTADVVEVVRCKDCEYYTAEDRWCRRLGLCGAFDADDYCSHGERKETEDE